MTDSLSRNVDLSTASEKLQEINDASFMSLGISLLVGGPEEPRFDTEPCLFSRCDDKRQKSRYFSSSKTITSLSVCVSYTTSNTTAAVAAPVE